MARAKIDKPAVAKKARKPDAAAVRPVKESLTKSALINHLAEQNELPRKTAAAVYATLEEVFLGSVHPRGVGEFTLPGLLKVRCARFRHVRPALWFATPPLARWSRPAAKPASVRVKVRALSKLKTAATP